MTFSRPKFLRRRSVKAELQSILSDEPSEASTVPYPPVEANAIEQFFISVFPSESDSVTEESSYTEPPAVSGRFSKSFTHSDKDTSKKADVKTENPKEPTPIMNFFNSTSAVVGSVLKEAATMAGEVANDMGDIIMADENENTAGKAIGEKKMSTEKTATPSELKVRRSRSSASAKNVKANIVEEGGGKAQGEEEINESATSKFTKSIEVKRNRSTASAKNVKETGASEMREDKTSADQPTRSKSEAQGSPVTSAKLKKKLNRKGKHQNQPTSSELDVKANPATLAKLMTKLDKKEKMIKKLEQQIDKAKLEMAETKKSVRALAAKFRGVLDMPDEDQSRDDLPRSDQLRNSAFHNVQSRDELSAISSLETESDDDDESEWGADELAHFYNSEQLKRLEKIFSETIVPVDETMVPVGETTVPETV